MNQPELSVIIPAYQAEGFLEAGVRSLLEQDFSRMEVILVDDGSRDGTGRICDALAAEDSRIRVIHQENTGPGGARNTGLDAARGEYVSFIDADDRLLPGAFRKMWEIVRREQPDLIRFGHLRTEGHEQQTWLHPYPGGLYEGEDLTPMRLDAISYEKVLDYSRRRISSVWACLFRLQWLREQKLRFRSEKEILNEDYLFMLQAIWQARRVWVMEEALYDYRIREGSVSRLPRMHMYQQKLALFRAYRDFLPQADPRVEQRLDHFYIDGIYNCITEAIRCLPPRQAVQAIRRVLEDGTLRARLRRAGAEGLKTRCICFLMAHRQAAAMYWLYRLCRR